MSIKQRVVSCAALLLLGSVSVAALADDHPYLEGPVSQVSSIRTVDGHFDEYMAWIDTVWKKGQEAAKKAGYITGYQVYAAQPRGDNDADVYLVVTYKNFAALDDWIMKGDVISKQMEGSVMAANKSEADRSKIRRVLGSETIQALNLK